MASYPAKQCLLLKSHVTSSIRNIIQSIMCSILNKAFMVRCRRPLFIPPLTGAEYEILGILQDLSPPAHAFL
ncbi:hypothetical protein XELAEV_18019780mg [Xenopus laevis]|uniref:Uncharacterized protein n=1 Tax=Xenopus laevis TaxID=8355 RepID=A0A974HQC9_XENLA|nr:hypothetical protein XELAEV_18019780mg [Xenopus laevis]